ncbi:MAG: protein kinase domain-containing protein [Ardenticatenaceae bacterium]
MLSPNDTLQNGRYRILGLLDENERGGVSYEAVDSYSNQPVVVKEGPIRSPELFRAVQGQLPQLVQLRHPALSTVIDSFVQREPSSSMRNSYLVMSHIEGQTLEERLAQQPGQIFPVSYVVAWAERLLGALTYLHTQNPPLIHGDIQPANLMLMPNGEIILLDVGLVEWERMQSPTHGAVAPPSTLDYLSPEQLMGQPSNTRSDLYELGATLYTLLTGQVPENPLNRSEQQFNKQRDLLIPANVLNPQVPPHVAEVLTDAMALNPAQRPATAAEMRARLTSQAFPPPSGGLGAAGGGMAAAPPTMPLHPSESLPSANAPTRINPQYQPSVDQQRGETIRLQEEQPPPPPPPPPPPSKQEPPPAWQKWAIPALGVILLLLLLCCVGLFWTNSRVQTAVSGPTEIPVLVPFTSTPTTESAENNPQIGNVSTSTPVASVPNPAQEPTTAPIPAQEPTNTPIPAQEPTLTPIPAQEPTLTPIPAEVPSGTTYNGPTRQGNGPDIRAPRRTFDVEFDGFLLEWDDVPAVNVSNVVFQPENWSGPEDLSGVVRAVWDEQYLYLAIQVTDEFIVQESEGRLLYQGDSIELFWDIDLPGDFNEDSYNADDAQMVFTPGDPLEDQPAAWVYFSPTGNFRDQIQVDGGLSEAGYDLEVRIPWSGLAITPQSGQVYGYAIALSDDDSLGSGEQETQMSTTPNAPFQNPAGWANFILEP